MGKGGGALSMWLKEFTALVFTQTIQAFIYAIIISIILFGMVNVSEVSADDNNSALGLMATFALLSVFKVEELAKKIFGVGDTKASPGNAMRSIAKTAIAAKLGSRVLNNAGKVLGGVKAINKSRQDNRKTKERLNEDMEDNGFVKNKDGKYEYVGTQKARQKAGSSSVFAASSVGATSDKGTGGSGGGAETSSGGGTSDVGGGESVAVMSDAAQRRMRNALRSYDDKLSEIKKARDQGIKDIASGLTESIGATFGATAGGILGGADGNLDEMLQGIMAGAGAGDIVGKSTVEAVDRAVQFAQRNINRKAGISSRELQRSLKAAKDAVAATQKEYGSVEDAND